MVSLACFNYVGLRQASRRNECVFQTRSSVQDCVCVYVFVSACVFFMCVCV